MSNTIRTAMSCGECGALGSMLVHPSRYAICDVCEHTVSSADVWPNVAWDSRLVWDVWTYVAVIEPVAR